MKKRLALALFLLLPSLALACFGTELRIGVGKDPKNALFSYALGFFIEEKTGIEPLFVEVDDSPSLLADKKIDLRLLPATAPAPTGAVRQETVNLPDYGEAFVWLTHETVDDLRFTTIERTLKIAGGFFNSKAMSEAASHSGDPKKAARKAVLDAQ